MERNVRLRLGEVIAEIRHLYLQHGADGVLANEDWYLYTADDVLSPDTACLISDPVDVDEDTYNEILPEAAVLNDMLNPISCEIVNDVTVHALYQDASASVEMLVDALNYYLENDCFIEL